MAKTVPAPDDPIAAKAAETEALADAGLDQPAGDAVPLDTAAASDTDSASDSPDPGVPAPADIVHPELVAHAEALGLDLNNVVRDAIDAVNNPVEPVEPDVDPDLVEAAAAQGLDLNNVVRQALLTVDVPPPASDAPEIAAIALDDLARHNSDTNPGPTTEGPALAEAHAGLNAVVIGGPELKGGRFLAPGEETQIGDSLISASPALIWRPNK